MEKVTDLIKRKKGLQKEIPEKQFCPAESLRGLMIKGTKYSRW